MAPHTRPCLLVGVLLVVGIYCIQPALGFVSTDRPVEGSDTQCNAIKHLLTNSIDQNTQIQLRYETQQLYICYIFIVQWLYTLVSCFYLLQSTQTWDTIRYRLAFHLKCSICLALAVMAMLMHQHFNLPFQLWHSTRSSSQI
jgi:hypothetical protein